MLTILPISPLNDNLMSSILNECQHLYNWIIYSGWNRRVEHNQVFISAILMFILLPRPRGKLMLFLKFFATLGTNDSALILNLSRSAERAFHISRFDIDVTIIAIQNKKPSAGIIYRWNKGKHLVCIISAQIDYFSLETGPFRAATKRLVFSRSRAMISGHFSSGLL